MNKQSNSYTLIYSIGLILLVGIVLSVIYQALKPQQDENIANDKKRQILAAANITAQNGENISDLFNSKISECYVINHNGEIIDKNSEKAFNINVSAELKKPIDQMNLPVFVCDIDDSKKYIVPVYGNGLWGPIWGYISFNSDGNTIYGAYFAHQGETPGLGAEIETPDFQRQFVNKNIFNSKGEFESIEIVKPGREPSDKVYVYAISGGTITSQGVQRMLNNSLAPYEKFFKSLNSDKK